MRRRRSRRRVAARFASAPFLALVALLVGTLIVPSIASAQDDPGELLEEGRRAFEREEFERARERLWAFLDATSNLTGAARLPQAEALYYIALMEADAAVARRHYQIIVDEFPASPVADGALHRLAVLNLVEGQADLAIQQFEQLQRDYPVSRYQPEMALWIGQARLAAGDPGASIETFLEGFTRVKSGDLPREISMSQRDALAAEYAHWLARAYTEAGDRGTATQYYTLLTLDYPDSPQAADARQQLASLGPLGGAPVVASAAGEREPGAQAAPPVAGAAPARAGAPAGEAEEPREEEVEDIAVADPVAAAPAGVGRGEGRPVETPPEAAGEELVGQPAPEQPVEQAAAERATDRPRPRGEQPADRPVNRPADQPDLEPPAKFAPGAGSADLIYLQVGAFASASRAADLSKRLKADGFNSTVQIAVVDGRGFYRVRIGPFRISADATRIDRDRRRLTELGYPIEQVPASQ